MNRLSFLKRIIGVGSVAALAPTVSFTEETKSGTQDFFECDFNFYVDYSIIVGDEYNYHRICVPYVLKDNSYRPTLKSLVYDKENQIEYMVVAINTDDQVVDLLTTHAVPAKSFYKDGVYLILPPREYQVSRLFNP